jgi:hypothetical protein
MDVHATVTEFFHAEVVSALRAQSVTAAEPTEFYLVNLLAEFTKQSHVDDEPLALKLAGVAHAAPDVKAKGLKEVGDTSLVVSGFFGESLTRRLVDVDYYMAMGCSAYGQLATLMEVSRGSGSAFFRAAYQELAAKFAAFVQVLSEIRRKTNFAGASGPNLLRLCEAWARTGNEWLERRLREAGVVNLPEPGARAKN